MNSKLRLTVIAMLLVCVTSFAVAASRDWSFVQSVGGIALGAPHRDDRGHISLPIRCDVSGTQTITVPVAMNSALACDAPAVRIRAGAVFLTIRTALASQRHDARCPDADLGLLVPGQYSVVYESPEGSHHPLGLIHIPR